MKPYIKPYLRTQLVLTLVAGMMILLVPMHSNAQIIDPLKEYTNPEEIVTFDKSTTYNEAIEIINTFAQEFENKFIVDNSGYSGAIGVSLPPMHWKDALQYILKFQNLELIEYPEYYEIKIPAPKTTEVVGGNAKQSSTGDASSMIATTDTREIRINATFFEGNKRALQEIGVDWSTLTDNVPSNISTFVGSQNSATVPQTTFGDQFVSVNSYNAQNVSSNAFNALVNLGELGTGISVQALFSSFEADNLGKVLATPSIKVVDGEEGNIQVGQDFSIKQRDIAGNVTDNFVSTGTILTVTPQIITVKDTSFIYLDLSVERSTVQPDVISTIVNKQQATTSAILLNGESTYVAGLYRTEETEVRRGVPILKDLPGWFFGLRYLFGYNSQDYLENELIIIVQAELIKPVSERYSDQRLTRREVLEQTRGGMRTDIDRVFMVDEVPEIPLDSMAMEDSVATLDEESVEETLEADSTATETNTEEVSEVPTEPEKKDALTDDQKVIAEKLSIPVDYPELMVVVPKAFDLNQFLKMQENGEEVQTDDATSGMQYFVIGGSFLVPRNATNFKATLEKQGYDTRILFNPESMFNYVAYQGFSDFEEAVKRTIEIRRTINSEAWMFTLPPK